MAVTEVQNYRFEDVEIDLQCGCLKRGNNEKHLRQKSFQVLVYLLERHERLVTKDELIKNVWKDTAVTDDVLVQCVKEIRRAIGDDSHNPRFIKTVPKYGYRFIGTISETGVPTNGFSTQTTLQTEEITRIELEFEEDTDPSAKEKTAQKNLDLTSTLKTRRLYSIFAALLLLIFAFGFAVYFIPKFAASDAQNAEMILPSVAGKKSLAVMYFENQTASAELEWMREGLADMLITNLSRSNKLNVLSRQQFQSLLEKNGYRQDEEIPFDKIIGIARKSRAENFITGSFAKIGEKIRIDAQLHDSENGALLATESLTVEKPEQILTEIDLLSLKLAKHLGSEEKANLASFSEVMTDNLEAFRYYSLAVEKAQGLHKEEALELLEKAVALDPDFAMAHARIGYIYAVTWGWAEKGKPFLEKAFALSDRLTERDRLYIGAWYAIANLDYPAAIRSFREIINKYPLETEAYLRLGYLLKGEEQFDEAIGVLKQGLTIEPDSPALYNALGLIYSLLGRHEEAITMHKRYVALAPDEANAHDSLGMSYQWAGRYAEAINEYTRALELNRNFEIAHIHLGIAYFQTGRYRMAIDRFKEYIAVVPSKLDASRGYGYIAHVYRKQKNYEAAEQAAKKALEGNEMNIFPLFLTASERGDRATAKKFEDKLFAEPIFSNRGNRLTPRFSFYYRGYIALKNGQADEALENFRTALRYSPPNWDIDPLEDCLANAFLELGKFDDAINEYQRILQLNPNYPLARFYLAQAYEQKGMIDEARNSYRIFLQNWSEADADIPEVIVARKFFSES